jgi:hypothetical protein
MRGGGGKKCRGRKAASAASGKAVIVKRNPFQPLAHAISGSLCGGQPPSRREKCRRESGLAAINPAPPLMQGSRDCDPGVRIFGGQGVCRLSRQGNSARNPSATYRSFPPASVARLPIIRHAPRLRPRGPGGPDPELIACLWIFLTGLGCRHPAGRLPAGNVLAIPCGRWCNFRRVTSCSGRACGSRAAPKAAQGGAR